MSDPTPGSVRTGSRPEGAVQADGSPRGSTAGSAPASGSVTQTQALPPTGGMRAQAPSTGANPAQAAPQRSAAAPAGRTAAGASGTANARTARVRGKAGRGPRRAKLQLRHIDTWSSFKISLVLSIALFFIWMVAIGILYGVLSGLGVFNTLNDLFGQLGSANGSKGASSDVITPGVVFGGAAVIGAINIVLMTALCTVATFIYNLCADLVGGLEVTLSERD